jgi:hypothetical protein
MDAIDDVVELHAVYGFTVPVAIELVNRDAFPGG